MADTRVSGQPWWVTGLTILLLSIPFFRVKFRPAEQDSASRTNFTSEPIKYYGS